MLNVLWKLKNIFCLHIQFYIHAYICQLNFIQIILLLLIVFINYKIVFIKFLILICQRLRVSIVSEKLVLTLGPLHFCFFPLNTVFLSLASTCSCSVSNFFPLCVFLYSTSTWNCFFIHLFISLLFCSELRTSMYAVCVC